MFRYAGFKEVIKVVALPDKPSVVGLIDVDKGNLMDILQQKYLKSIPFWDGTCSKAGPLACRRQHAPALPRTVATACTPRPPAAWRCSTCGLARSARLSSPR